MTEQLMIHNKVKKKNRESILWYFIWKNDTNNVFFLSFPLKLELSYSKAKSISISLSFTIYSYSIFHCCTWEIKHEIELMENTVFLSQSTEGLVICIILQDSHKPHFVTLFPIFSSVLSSLADCQIQIVVNNICLLFLFWSAQRCLAAQISSTLLTGTTSWCYRTSEKLKETGQKKSQIVKSYAFSGTFT